MISIEEAQARILAAIEMVGSETISLREAAGRIIAEDIASRRTQPPFDASAMDGWAVRRADLGGPLKRVGQSQAGAGYAQALRPGEAVRIFTGAPIPEGADTIVLQEDADEAQGSVTIRQAPAPGKHIRRRGLDFEAGQVLFSAGHVVAPRDMALLAAMNIPWLKVRRRPRVAILATGDELVLPGEPAGPDQIIASNHLGLAGLVESCGAEALDLGIAKDEPDALIAGAKAARGADFLVTIGGASVGERDLVASSLSAAGLELDFWKIAMRPGKPLMSGKVSGIPFLGLPGNPVAAMICGMMFLKPALMKMTGRDPRIKTVAARLGKALAANDRRADFLRARITGVEEDRWIVEAFDIQDSSMLSVFAAADVVILRPPHAPAADVGASVEVLVL